MILNSQTWFYAIVESAANPQAQPVDSPPPATKIESPKQQERPQSPQKQPGQLPPLYQIADYQLLNSYPPPPPAYLIYPDPYAYQPMSTIPAAPLTPTSRPQLQIPQQQQQQQQQQYQQQQAKAKSGIEDKQYGALQNSLIESGFSIKRLLEVFNWLPVSSGILQVFVMD